MSIYNTRIFIQTHTYTDTDTNKPVDQVLVLLNVLVEGGEAVAELVAEHLRVCRLVVKALAEDLLRPFCIVRVRVCVCARACVQQLSCY